MVELPKPPTELYEAARNGKLDEVKRLLDGGADVNEIGMSATGQRALHGAVLNGQVEMVKFLLERGADPKAENGLGYMPLNFAPLLKVREGNVKAAEEKAVAIAKLLIDKEAPVDGVPAGKGDGWTTVLRAADNGMPKLAQLLLDHGADAKGIAYHPKGFSIEGLTYMHRLAEKSDRKSSVETMGLMLEHGANPNVISQGGYPNFPLHEAVESLSNPSIMTLRTESAPNKKAAEQEYKKNTNAMVTLFLDKGADLNCVDKDGNAPAHIAGRYGDVGTLKQLVEKGARLDLKTADTKETPLDKLKEALKDKPGEFEKAKANLQETAQAVEKKQVADKTRTSSVDMSPATLRAQLRSGDAALHGPTGIDTVQAPQVAKAQSGSTPSLPA